MYKMYNKTLIKIMLPYPSLQFNSQKHGNNKELQAWENLSKIFSSHGNVYSEYKLFCS